MGEFTRDEVLKASAWLSQWERKSGARIARKMLDDYAAMLERPAQWPSDEDVDNIKRHLQREVLVSLTRDQLRAALQAVVPVQASSCTEERPCTPCFIGKGVCKDVNAHWQEQPPVQASAIPVCWSLKHKDGTGALFADCIYDNEEDARNDAVALNGDGGQLVPVPLFTHPPVQVSAISLAERIELQNYRQRILGSLTMVAADGSSVGAATHEVREIFNSIESSLSKQPAQASAVPVAWMIEWDSEDGRKCHPRKGQDKPRLDCFPIGTTAHPLYAAPQPPKVQS